MGWLQQQAQTSYIAIYIGNLHSITSYGREIAMTNRLQEGCHQSVYGRLTVTCVGELRNSASAQQAIELSFELPSGHWGT